MHPLRALRYRSESPFHHSRLWFVGWPRLANLTHPHGCFPFVSCEMPGLEFDEQVVRLGNHTKFRVAAKVSFPRYFPWDEDDDPLLVEFRRLGLKTVLK